MRFWVSFGVRGFLVCWGAFVVRWGVFSDGALQFVKVVVENTPSTTTLCGCRSGATFLFFCVFCMVRWGGCFVLGDVF